MAIFLDFVGLNTLVYENVTSSMNLIGSENVTLETVSTAANEIAKRNSKALRSASTTTNESSLGGFPSGYPTTGGFSNSFWVKLDNTSSGIRTIWNDTPAGTIHNSLEFYNNSIQFLAVQNGTTNYKKWIGPADFDSFTSWNHIVVTWDGDFASYPSLYVNGSSVPFETIEGTATGTTREDIVKLLLFDRPNTDPLYELKGSLQEFAFYNKVLTTAEISEIYNNGNYIDLSTSTIVGDILDYWRLGEELTSYEIGDSVPSSTNIAPTTGTTTLVANDNITVSAGFHGSKSGFIYENNLLAILPDGTSLAALNIHRNGPYGHNTFKQLRSSQNPLTRYHNKNSIFSYVLDGNTVVSNGREVFKAKNTAIRQIQESPIITNNKPLTLVGGVSEYNRRTGKTTIERVEVLASPTNEIQFFGDKQTNREFGLDFETHETYEELTDLYLDGGIEGDDSPIDQFELLRYQHQIYPQEGNTYLGHVRGRPNFVSGYWRDNRTDRTEVSSSEIDLQNGFGFSVPSQSMWPLDVEDGWATRDLAATVGTMTMSAPTEFRYSFYENFNALSASAIVLDPAGDGFAKDDAGSSDNIYLYAQEANSFNTDTSYVYGSTFGYVRGGKYRLNSSRGVARFYSAWMGLMEDAGFRIDSENRTIPTRDNVDTTSTSYVSSDPYYLEIDNVAGPSHFTTELSHSLVHWWTKDEDSFRGHIYNEKDSTGGIKRKIDSVVSDYYVYQAPIFEIVEEDGTVNSYFTASSIASEGLLQYKFDNTSIASYVGNEWNNNIVKFGDPVADGDEAIKFYSNGNSVAPEYITDALGFFDSNGDMRAASLRYEDSTLTSYAWEKTSLYGDNYLRWGGSTSSFLFEKMCIGFYYKTDRTNFTGHSHQIIKTTNGTDEYKVELVYLSTPQLVALRVTIQDNSSIKKIVTFDINHLYSDLTKYLIFDPYGTAIQAFYYNKTDEEVVALSVLSTQTLGSISSFEYKYITEIVIFDETKNVFPYPTTFSANSDLDTLADVVILHSQSVNPFLGGDPTHRESYFNAEATIDFTSSFWTNDYPSPGFWYRFGNGANDTPNVGQTYRLTTAANEVDDYSGNSRHLVPQFYDDSRIDLERVDGPTRESYLPLGFQTSSIGEAYVLCESSSTNNSANDYFQNAKIAEFALIPSQSTTDITDYISSPFYQFTDLTSSAVTTSASVWYSFDNATDSIGAAGATIINQNTDFATFQLTGAYTSATAFPNIENDGLVVTGSTSNEVEFKIRYREMNFNTSSLGVNTPPTNSAGILNYVSSSITGDISNLYIGGAQGYNAQLGPGVLMNSYNSFNIEPILAATDLDTYLSAACLYTRRHTLMTASSFQHPFVATDYGSFFKFGTPDDYDGFELYQGMAQWDAPAQSGKKPFYDTYGAYAAEMRLTNKDHSVVPEFRISQHIDKYLLKGDTEFSVDDNPLLEVTGGHKDKSNSNLDDFYETYSTTDFLKMFDLIQEEHDDFVNPISLKLKCKGVKKFLPYKGFYPADRTVEISQQFYDSYKDYLTISSSYTPNTPDYAVQNLLTPLFSPGILFNTIKSGVACDYPIMTGSFTTSSVDDPLDPGTPLSGTYNINEQFHKRIPFEALMEPEKYLANQPLHPQEPDPLGNLDMTVTWNGGGDEKYRLMVSNFLAETGEFFLRNKDFASISSLPEGDPNFGNAEAGKTYAMRIKMYRTISGDKELWELNPNETYTYTGDTPPIPQGTFSVPQDTGSMEQAFMMYSRPSAFGPPQRITVEGQHNDEHSFNFTTWADYKKGTDLDYFYTVYEDVVSIVGTTTDPAVVPDGFDDLRAKEGVHYLVANDADAGYNYPFTPPYYHGEAWADVLFRSQNTEKLSLSQIINSSSVEFLRFYEATPTPEQNNIPAHYHNSWRLINEDAMQIASSVNIFSKGVLKQDITQTKRKGIRNDVQVQVDTNVGNQYRWIIQSKFETPILNFKKYTHNGPDVTLPLNSTPTTPIGMWHQYGELPQSPNEGVFMQVTEVPDQWIDNAMNAKSYQTGSLVELCGFSTDPVRLGDIAPTKTIKEAVVAIPFVEKSGQKRFFTIDREDIQNAIEPSTRNLVGKTVQDMVKKMKDYVFPPSMDFINNDDIDPFAMYVFEFKHTLDKQDLADIWQNLSPDIGEQHEEAEAVISHELLAHELLGGRADLKPGRNTEFELNRQVRKEKLDSRIRWMIFKVKQRAKTNYFEKIFARNESQEAGSKLNKTTLSSTGASKNASYNWPYDYFSLVELVKMDAEIDFARPDDENQEEKLVIKPYTKVVSNAVNQTILNNALFGTELPEPEPPQGVIQERIPRGKKKR